VLPQSYLPLSYEKELRASKHREHGALSQEEGDWQVAFGYGEGPGQSCCRVGTEEQYSIETLFQLLNRQTHLVSKLLRYELRMFISNVLADISRVFEHL